MSSIRIGTRGSRLALIQAEMFRLAIERSGYSTEIVEIESEGDRDKTSPLREIKKKGVFSSTLNDMVLAKDVDIAVHSAKDLPTFLPEEIRVAGVLPRGPPEDILVSPMNFSELPSNSCIGTSSFRRKIEIQNHRPDLTVKDIRGNIETRIRKVSSGEYDAVMIAHAAFKRLELEDKHEIMSISEFPPAPNQGIIAATAIPGTIGFSAASDVSDRNTMRHFLIEKAVLESMKFSCDDPVSVYSHTEKGRVRIALRIYSLSGTEYMDFATFLEGDLASAVTFAEKTKNKIPVSYGYKWSEKTT